MSRRTQLDTLDLAIVAFRDALDEMAEIADKMERFTELFEQLMDREADKESEL